MSFKFSHMLTKKTENGEDVITLSPSKLTKTIAFAPLALGLLFVLQGGISGLLGVLLLSFGVIMCINMKNVVISKRATTITPALKKHGKIEDGKDCKIFSTEKDTFLITSVKSDFSFNTNNISFFPLNADRLTVENSEGDIKSLAYLSASDAQIIMDFIGKTNKK